MDRDVDLLEKINSFHPKVLLVRALSQQQKANWKVGEVPGFKQEELLFQGGRYLRSVSRQPTELHRCFSIVPFIYFKPLYCVLGMVVCSYNACAQRYHKSEDSPSFIV
jgi:hypothetical protein